MQDNNNKKVAKSVSRILRVLAKIIEENPDMLGDTGLSLGSIPAVRPKKKAKEPPVDIDIFQIFAEGGGPVLREKLDMLDSRTLKRIVSQHALDPSKLSSRWRKKERLLNLIMERVSDRSNKGKVFEEYP